MRSILLSLMAALIAVQAPRSAPAQPQVSIPLVYLETTPEQLVEASFSASFGRLLVTEFAAAIGEGADAACLKTNGIEKSALDDRARTIMLRNGAQNIRTYLSAIDQSAFKTRLAARMGANAEAELAGLRGNKDVRAFLYLSAPARHAAVSYAVVETLGRIVSVLKINLSRRFDPISTGNAKHLNADPTEATGAKVDAFVKANQSAALTRYFYLMDAAQEALNQSIDAKAYLSMRVVDLMPGLEKDLADVCVFRHK